MRLRSIRGRAVAPASKVCVKRVSQSAFRSDPQNIQSGKASLIEYLFDTTDDNGRCAEDEIREGEESRRPREGAREREDTRDGGGLHGV